MAEDEKQSCEDVQSKALPGPHDLRYYPAYKFVAWQPRGVLDDVLLEAIGEWLVAVEKAFPPFKRYVDLSQLSSVAVRTRHVFRFAQKRAAEFASDEPIRSAIYCDDWVGFGIARLYESLMEHTMIKVRAFRERAGAAHWLGVPAEVLMLSDEPQPHGARSGE